MKPSDTLQYGSFKSPKGQNLELVNFKRVTYAQTYLGPLSIYGTSKITITLVTRCCKIAVQMLISVTRPPKGDFL